MFAVRNPRQNRAADSGGRSPAAERWPAVSNA